MKKKKKKKKSVVTKTKHQPENVLFGYHDRH